MAQNLYGPRVRMGNWNEDSYLEEDRMKDFLDKRDKGKLLIQRNRKLKKNLLRPTQLSVSEDGYIHYGHKIMLINLNHPRGDEAGVFMDGDMTLSMTPDEINAQLSDELEVPCGLSACQTRVPMSRNTFTILSAKGEADQRLLRYGQDFCLQIAGGLENKLLYLSSDHRTLLKSAKKSWLQEVDLTEKISHLTCWQAAFIDPQLRLEFEGFPVRANEKLIIYHRHTNRALAAHRHLTLSTYFGTEIEVAAHTHLDPHRMEKPNNHWMLVTGNPRNSASTMLDLTPPTKEDACAREQALSLSPK